MSPEWITAAIGISGAIAAIGGGVLGILNRLTKIELQLTAISARLDRIEDRTPHDTHGLKGK